MVFTKNHILRKDGWCLRWDWVFAMSKSSENANQVEKTVRFEMLPVWLQSKWFIVLGTGTYLENLAEYGLEFL